jgi:hypothetical protein
MKKLLALLATVFMVTGMFVGVAFAHTSTTELKITLNTDTLIVGEEDYTISGTIKKPNGKLITEPVDVELVGAAKEVTTVAINGAFTLEMNHEDLTPNTTCTVVLSGTWFEAAGGEGETLPQYANPETAPSVDYRYNVVLDSEPALKYNDTNKILTGKVVNSKNVGVAGVQVGFSSIDTDVTRSNGMFVLDLDVVDVAGEEFITVATLNTATDPDTWFPYMNTKAITVAGIAFHELSAAKSVVHSAFPANLGLVVETTSVSGDLKNNALAKYTFTGVKIEGPIAGADAKSVLSGTDYTKLIVIGTSLPGTMTLLEKGTLHVEVSYDGGKYVGSVDIEVTDPQAINLNVVTAPASVSVNAGPFGITTFEVVDKDGAAVDHFDWEVSGTGFEANADEGDNLDWNALVVTPVTGGKLTLKVTGYDEDDAVVGTTTLDVEIDGYTYTITPSEITVNTAADITVVVKDLDGNLVNNAIVTLSNGTDEDIVVDAADTNINNGTYKFEDVEVTTVDNLEVIVEAQDGTVMVDDVMTVNGEKAYNIELLTDKITAGVASEIELKVTDLDGEVVYGLDAVDTIYVDGVSISDANIEFDEETEIYTLSDVVVVHAEDVKVEVKTTDDTEVGELPITVLLPVVTVNPNPITYLYTEEVTITVTDPITGEGLDADLVFDSLDLNLTLDTADDSITLLTDITGADKYVFDLTAVPFDEDEDDEVTPTLTITDIVADGDVEVEIPVVFGDATLSMDVTDLYIGYGNRVAFGLKNARGEAVAEYKIFQGSTEIGITDENGGLLYSVTPAATGKITFKAATDVIGEAAEFVTASAYAKQDLTGPAINIVLPATTTEGNLVLTGTITDDTRVASVYVNNVPVAIIPGKSTTFVYSVALRDGANTISVIALDANGNGTPFIGTVTKAVPTPKSVSVTIGKVDANAGLDVAAYLEPGRTMVPLAFVTKTLGGTATWDAATNTVTIVLNGKTAVLTIGSKNATVNGAPTTLVAAATAKNGRTFVALADLANLLGATSSWDEATQTATIVLP